MKKKIKDLKPGDRLDLEEDKYADPTKDNPVFQCEILTVESVEKETENCYVVSFSNYSDIGFPPNHEVDIVKGINVIFKEDL